MNPSRDGPATACRTEKRPARASRGMVVTNHPLASAAGAEMLAAGALPADSVKVPSR